MYVYMHTYSAELCSVLSFLSWFTTVLHRILYVPCLYVYITWTSRGHTVFSETKINLNIGYFKYENDDAFPMKITEAKFACGLKIRAKKHSFLFPSRWSRERVILNE